MLSQVGIGVGWELSVGDSVAGDQWQSELSRQAHWARNPGLAASWLGDAIS